MIYLKISYKLKTIDKKYNFKTQNSRLKTKKKLYN